MSRITSHAAATMTVTVKEAVTINGRDYGSTQNFSMASIADVNRRVITVTTTEASILSFGAASAGGTFIPAKVKYMRFTNLDGANFIALTFQNENADEFQIKLDAGQSFVFAGDNSGGMADVCSANIVNLGMQAFTDATCDYNDDPTIACDASAKIKKGQSVSGTGIPVGATVDSVNIPGAVTSFELSASTTGGSVTNGTLTFTPNLQDLSTIKADADTGSCDLEVFVASIA
tara:strand:+ start:6400 stop:7095 length:696 start_codon:yes stop_codon:yes gene_type:complete